MLLQWGRDTPNNRGKEPITILKTYPGICECIERHQKTTFPLQGGVNNARNNRGWGSGMSGGTTVDQGIFFWEVSQFPGEAVKEYLALQ